MTELLAARNIVKRFGGILALNDVTLSVSPGCVFGLVGENGAGKSTLIKHLLGLWRAQTGTVRLFGLDPVADPVAVHVGGGRADDRLPCDLNLACIGMDGARQNLDQR